ncbi:MAG: peptidoglycan DD-metalloendopeptidase family protein, partial [Aggregatilineales bacterium]
MRLMTGRFCTVFIIFWMMSVFALPAIAQTDCETVSSVQMPIDTDTFTLVQDFAVRSVRHEGRFHIGEDWYAGRGNTAGQPVQAVANGRVTFSSENGWGADGGVVILEHILPDERVFYTQYGHLSATAAMPFPARLACVSAGDIIGVVGDVRPAPHLHFEVRVDNPASPGPGYLRENPYSAGWRNPGAFITGLQTASHSAYLWQVTVENDNSTAGLSASPFLFNDDSLLYLTGRILRRITPDGRILWRQNLEKDAVSITGIAGETHLTYSDGTMELVDAEDGVTDEVWRIDATFTGAPIIAGGWLLFPSENNQLIAIDETRRNILWTLDDVPPVIRSQIVGEGVNFTIALLTQSQEML